MITDNATSSKIDTLPSTHERARMALSGMPFWKYAACGNDFILIDNRDGRFPVGDRQQIKNACHRNLGIGADGVILLEHSDKADLRMRIFNADGSEAEMCGNGIRCLTDLAKRLGWSSNTLQIETMNRIYPVAWAGNNICVTMGPPKEVRWHIPLELDHRRVKVQFLNTGVPHAILFVERVDNLDVMKWGRMLRYHSCFGPAGANANFARLDGLSRIWLRTYERGVEAETLACGTGATAAALAAAHLHHLKSPIEVFLKSGDTLSIGFTPDFHEVTLTGLANLIYEGKLSARS